MALRCAVIELALIDAGIILPPTAGKPGDGGEGIARARNAAHARQERLPRVWFPPTSAFVEVSERGCSRDRGPSLGGSNRARDLNPRSFQNQPFSRRVLLGANDKTLIRKTWIWSQRVISARSRASEAWNSLSSSAMKPSRFGSGGSGVVIESGYSPVGQDNNACPRCAFAASKGIEVAGATGAMRRGNHGKYGARGNRIPVCF